MTTRGDFVASIFMVIAIPGMTLFILRLCLHYIFQKATGRKDLSKIEKEQPIFCRILYLYPWKYIERYKIIFALIQIMYFISICSIGALIVVFLSEYMHTGNLVKTLNSNHIAYAMLPMMICMLVAPILYSTLQQFLGKEREPIDTERIEKLLRQYMQHKAFLQKKDLSRRKMQRIVEDMTATLVYILKQMDTQKYFLDLEERTEKIVFAINGLEEIELFLEQKHLEKDLNWSTFTMYSYPFVHQYHCAKEKYLSKKIDNRDDEFDNMELVVSAFFNQIMCSYESFRIIAYDPAEYLKRPLKIFLHLLDDFEQRCYEQQIENTEEIKNYYYGRLNKLIERIE